MVAGGLATTLAGQYLGAEAEEVASALSKPLLATDLEQPARLVRHAAPPVAPLLYAAEMVQVQML